jgi:hypothetical protein
MYFIYLFENKTMKAIEIILRIEEKETRKDEGGVNLIKVHCKSSENVTMKCPCTSNV